MENETAPKKTEQESTFTMDLAEAISRMASAMVSIAKEQDLLRQAHGQLLEERKQLVELVTALTAKVNALVPLVDSNHAEIKRLTGKPEQVPPLTPKGGFDVN